MIGTGLFCFLLPAYGESSKLSQLIQKAKEDPLNVEIQSSLAMEFTIQKNYSKALEAYFQVLQVDPNNFHAYNNMGIIYKKVGQLKDSLFCYQNAQKLRPDYYLVPYNMGLAYEAMGRLQEAREAYGKALSLKPDFDQASRRLRELTEPSASRTPLPRPPAGKIWIADSPDRPPMQISSVAGFSKGPKAEAKDVVNFATPIKKTPAASPSLKIKEAPTKTAKKPEIVRTVLSGPGASFYNKAMNFLDEGKAQQAVENYVACILQDHKFLAEPDNGLIQKGIALLEDRPNSMSEGLFYRGYLKFVSAQKLGAKVDLKQYMEGNPNGSFFSKAEEIVEKIEEEIIAAEEEEAARIAAMKMETVPGVGEATYTPRLGDNELKGKSSEEIIAEAKRLSQEGRLRDSIAVLRAGLDQNREDLMLLMAIANSYTDMMLLKGDKEAGKMARDIFEKIISIAPSGSKEAMIAKNMAQELTTRLR